MRTRLFFLAACSGLLLANGARLDAQTTTNVDCWTYSSGSVSCRSRTSPDLGTSIANVFAAYAEDQRRREATQRAEQLAASQRALTEALARDREYAARVDQERAQAQARLFWRRAEHVLSSVADSFALDLRAAEMLNESAVPLLADLVLAYPDASIAAITENLLPVTTPIVRRSSALWDASQEWIDRNQRVISTTSIAEKELLAESLVSGRAEAMSFPERGTPSSALTASADSALARIQRNRRVCADGNPACDRVILPSALQRAHDTSRATFLQRERVRTTARQAVVDSAKRIISARVDGPGLVPVLEYFLERTSTALPLALTTQPKALADSAFAGLAMADEQCKLMARCEAGRASPDAIQRFEALTAERANADTVAARQTCRQTPLDCRLNLIPAAERAEYEILAEDARRFPARWRLPAAVSAMLAGPDTVVSFATEPYRQWWLMVGGRAQLSRHTHAAAGRQVIAISWREELFVNGSPARRMRFHMTAQIDATTGAVLRNAESFTSRPTDPLAVVWYGIPAPSCFEWMMPTTGSVAGSPDAFGNALLFLFASVFAVGEAPRWISAHTQGNTRVEIEQRDGRYVTSIDGRVRGSVGRTADGRMFYSYDATSSYWLQQQTDLWADPWADDPALACRAR